MPGPDVSSGPLRGRLGAALAGVAVLLSGLVLVDERLVAAPVLVGLVAAGLAVLQVRADRAVETYLRWYSGELEEAVELTFGRAAVPIATHFPDGTMRANRATFDLLGAPPIDGPFTYADIPVRGVTPREDLDLVRYAEGRPDVFTVNRAFQIDGGRLVHTDLHANVVRDEHGAVRWVTAY